MELKGETLMSRIQLLDDLTIQKIAAGEVIERPSSIIKELIENSIDANARNIVVEINDGGKTYIRVTDDGEGIEEDEIELAFKRHSTSKLKVIDDLNNIFTLGFRGEALASVAAVSKVEVLTKTKDSSAGIHAFIEEGKLKSIDKVGTPKGTTMIVKDLFYNLPVRKKFLKSNLSEGNSVSDIVYKLALGNYNTSFKFIKDNKTVLKTSTNGIIKDNIYTILGRDISNGLIPVNFDHKGVRIVGFISNNNLYRSNRSHQYLYVNGRYIVNYAISSAIEQHYKSLIPLNRFPVFILYIEMNPAEMDVNIHPTKQEIKFATENNIIGIISNVVKDTLFPSLTIAKFELEKEEKKEDIKFLYKDNENTNIVVRDYSNVSLSNEDDKIFNNINVNNKVPVFNEISIKETMEQNFVIDYSNNEDIEIDNSHSIENSLAEITPLGIVFGTYILGENRVLNTLFFIDQHAAHERIMYEKYRKEFENESIHVQQLISPEIIDLTNSEFTLINDNLDFFKKMGFEIENFGSNSYAIRGVPFLFGNPNIRNLFLDILDSMDKNISSSYDTRLDKLMKLACISAIKSGDKMSNLEINALLKDLAKCENPYTCPHGRPTVIEITKKDIEKQFLRIV